MYNRRENGINRPDDGIDHAQAMLRRSFQEDADVHFTAYEDEQSNFFDFLNDVNSYEPSNK